MNLPNGEVSLRHGELHGAKPENGFNGLMNVSKDQGSECEHNHQTVGHELFGLGQSPPKKHQKKGQNHIRQNRRHVSVQETARGAHTQQSGKDDRSDDGSLAFRFEEAHQAASDEKDDVNPEDRSWIHKFFCRKIAGGQSVGNKQTVILQGRSWESGSIV